MSDGTPTTEQPFYRDDDEQFQARPVDDESMAVWEQSAAARIQHSRPGDMNWTMIVRSLIAEVRKLRKQLP